MENFYKYKAKVVGCYDGDTVTLEVSVGFNIKITEKFRLLNIDTPEIRGEERPEGLISRDYLRSLILDKEVVIETYKDKKGKYLPYLPTIFLGDLNINEHLVNEGYAKLYE